MKFLKQHIRLSIWLKAGLLSFVFSSALAIGLTDVQQSTKGDAQQLFFVFDNTPVVNNSFMLQNPPRLVLDVDNANNRLPSSRVDVNNALVSNINLIETPQRLRAIVNLTQSATHQINRNGNEVSVQLNHPAASATPATTAAVPVAYTTPQATAPTTGYDVPSYASGALATQDTAPAARSAQIQNVDFRRTRSGGGEIVIEASEPLDVSVKSTPSGVFAQVLGYAMPAHLIQTVNVSDFGTPVQKIKSSNRKGSAEFQISTKPGVRFRANKSPQGATITIQKLPDPVTKAKQNALHPLSGNKNYTGKRITLKFQDIGVRPLLQLIGDFTGQNIVASDAVNGSMSIQLENVPWDQALDIILSSNSLSQRRNGNVIYIAPTKEINATEAEALKLQETKQKQEALVSDYLQVNYAKAEDIVAMLQNDKANFLSERGSITVDARTNKILIKDTLQNVAQIQELIQQLDVPIRQVMIEARIVIATDSFTKELGSRFGITNVNSTHDANGKLTGVSSAVSGSTEASTDTSIYETWENIRDGEPGVEYPGLADRLNWNSPASSSAGAIAMSIFKNGMLIDMELSALEATGDGEIVSSPRIMTSDNQTARIEQGIEIPYEQATSSGATSVVYKKAVLSIEVTPQITPDNTINMAINITKDNAVADGEGAIQTREITTNVLVGDNETLVLGGIYEVEETSGHSKVPVLGDIPIVGRLFSYELNKNNKNELLVFVTPRIIKQGQTFSTTSSY